MDEWENFIKVTGMITNKEVLYAIGAPGGFEDNGQWSADRFSAKALIEFCEANPQYHILTSVEAQDDEYVDVLINDFALVNRLSYYLGTGSEDDSLFYTEKREAE